MWHKRDSATFETARVLMGALETSGNQTSIPLSLSLSLTQRPCATTSPIPPHLTIEQEREEQTNKPLRVFPFIRDALASRI